MTEKCLMYVLLEGEERARSTALIVRSVQTLGIHITAIHPDYKTHN